MLDILSKSTALLLFSLIYLRLRLYLGTTGRSWKKVIQICSLGPIMGSLLILRNYFPLPNALWAQIVELCVGMTRIMSPFMGFI